MLDAIVNLEPNWHPVFVHFVVGLLFTATAVLAVVAAAPQGWARRASLQAAGDWMLAIGIAAALVAVAAGFQAYYTVAHDEPAHEVMTEHRNWALATAGLFLLLGLWRWLRRDRAPSILFALALIVAAGLLTATAWRGGRLVFHHGLGVASLPQAEGPGHHHHHDHGDGQGHDEEGATAPSDGSGNEDEHEHEHGGGHDHEHGGHDAVHEEDSVPPSAQMSNQGPAGVVAMFHDALKRSDEVTVRKLLLPNVVIFESGNAERSFAEYAGRHMPADMSFAASVGRVVGNQRVLETRDAAVVLSEAVSKGTFRKQPVHARMMETMFLKRMEKGWKIAHIHWSSSKIVEKSAHDGDHDHPDGHEHEN